MSASGSNNFLNIEDANLRVRSGNVHALGMTVGGITVGASFGLQSVTNSGNTTSNTLQFTNATTAFVTTANVEIGGSLTVGGTKTFVVTVQQVSGVNKYFINGVDRPILQLHQYQTYIFDLSDSSLVGSPGHPFIFSETAAGDAYDTGITTTGTPGNAGAKKTFVVPAGAPTTLYYYCTQHVGMGATVNIGTVTDLVVSGTRGTTLGGGTTAQRSVYPLLGTIRYNSTTGYMEAYTVSGWSVIATPPSITSFDITNVAVAPVITDTITVSGSGFDAITNIQLRGADGKNYDTTTFTFTNSGSIGFKIGTLATGQLANRPYKVVVTNGAGLSATSSTTLGLGGVTWSSPAASSINHFLIGVSTSLALSASDGGGGSAVTYTLHSGSYLSGTFTLSGTTITGTTDAAENTTSSVTIRATDNADSSVFLDRTFTLKAVPAALYAFSSHTFTNAGKSGRTGPTLTNLTDTYTPAWTDYTSNLNVTTQGIQEWTVPSTGSYTIEAQGAGSGSASGVNDTRSVPARITGTFTLTSYAVLKILVGQTGGIGSDNVSYAGPGGGGTFVTYTNNTPLIVAGGGGGCTGTTATPNRTKGQTSNNGTTSGGAKTVANNGCAGAGLTGNGGVTGLGHGSGDGDSFTNGGVGGQGNGTAGGVDGGFGGGGARSGTGHGPGGGGGGYNGGEAGYYGTGDYNYHAGGGGSYNNGSSQINTRSSTTVNAGNSMGYVKITKN